MRIDGYGGRLPLSLYSLGSSFLGFILKDEDARDAVWLDFCDASSFVTASGGLTFSSWTGAPLIIGGFLPNGLRKGGMAACTTVTKNTMRTAIDRE